jgi:flagellin
MPIGILNNIPSLAAENQLTLTSSALSNTLEQLSSGSRINSGADDPAGLSIANGLQANISALTQSVSNANNGVGELQLADGALAQVTNLLNTAITLATESATGTVSNGQRTAIQAQYSSILAEINRIGTATTYNGQAVFQNGVSTNLNAVVSGNNATTAPLTTATPLTVGDTTTITAGGQTFSYTATASGTSNANTVTGSTAVSTATALNSGTVLTLTRGTGGLTTTYSVGAGGATIAQLIAAINTNSTQGNITVGGTDLTHTGYTASLNPSGDLQITDLNNNNDLTATLTGSSVANQVSTLGENYNSNTSLIADGVLTLTRGSDVATYTVGSAGATFGQLLTAINTATSQSTGTNQGITVASTAGGATATASLTASLLNGNLQIVDNTSGADGAFTAAETLATNTNLVQGATGSLTGSTALGAGDVFTATRNGTQLTTYTVGAAGATVAQLLTAINTGVSVPGTNGAANIITVGTSGGGSAANLSAALVSGHVQVNDLTNSGTLAFAETGAPNTNVVTSNSTTNITGASTIASGEIITLTRGNGVTVSYTSLSNSSTVTELIADIASGTTDANFTVSNSAGAQNLGLTAAVSNNQLVITDNTGGTLSATDSGTSLGGSANPFTHTYNTTVTGAYTDSGQQLVFPGSTNTNPVTGAFTASTSTPSTVQSLLNAINNDTVVGAKAALVNGILQITDPLDRGDLTVTTTDPVLGATVSGAPKTFANQTTTGTSPNDNQLVGSVSGLTLTSALTNGGITSFTAAGKTFTFTAGSNSTVGSLINAINSGGTTDPAGLSAYLNSAGTLVVTDPNDGNDLAVGPTATETVLGAYTNSTTTVSQTTDIFLSDSTAIGSSQIGVIIGGLSTSALTNGSGGGAVDLSTTDLNTQTDAQTALTQINAAITNIASVRGTLGASVNRLTAASNVLNSQVQNLTSAENTITAADIPADVANLTKYSILEQTGISALAQANQQQQLVLKLLQ